MVARLPPSYAKHLLSELVDEVAAVLREQLFETHSFLLKLPHTQLHARYLEQSYV